MREWLASIVGESLAPIMTVILAAALVVLLALVLIGLAKRVFAGSGGIGGRSRAPRLAVLDMAPVDPKRKLVLVRRDDVEHLILIGGQNDLVVEPGIVRGQQRRVRQEPGFAEPEQRVAPPQPPLPHRRSPRPTVQPTPNDGQDPGEHPALAPVAETPVTAPPEQRVQPAVRNPVPASERQRPMEPRAAEPTPTPVALPESEPLVEPAMAPAKPAAPVAPPPQAIVPPVAPPVRANEQLPATRPPKHDLPLEPTTPTRRATDMPSQPPFTAPPSPSVPITTFVEPLERRAEPAQPLVERPIPASPTYEPPRQSPIPPAPMPRPPVQPAAIVPPIAPSTTAPASPSGASAPRPPVLPPQPQAALQPPATPPRSMATPTLPQPSRATPVVPPVRNEPEVAPARSFWSTTPASSGPHQTAGNRDGETSRNDAIETRNEAPVPPLPERIPVRWPSAPVAPRADANADAEVGFAGPTAEPETATPAPLSVRSFASTIQDRRTPQAAEPSSPPVQPQRTPTPPQPAAPPVYAAAPVAAAPIAVTPSSADDEMPSSADERAERPLTLEEEMERLLHDFTIDVSERR
ncbi:flagellar biosynthetic protein FliO [Aureimonas phyllosphaerae]|uniref:Flagellar biosynthesis protein, FliO n=1 Tax=Aureimonas phyllosphaerae TaxID=1166078 RepID=A0A7W6FTY1_9HYPH|nr:flagellar biosynthetic protein FliO [Aureimonas phyllosphaerae]MBB3935220.1 hypothetical protein [Aureimonas phyllosphaerae]MBB3959228.1 hypothetical protein [Aureimonas phyllosphaerae]SFF06198.1 Flagellar biosynthesis protein, FliO [Aureimonas phyllosphaerae]